MNDERMNDNDDRHDEFEMPNDELDALLREWHEENAVRAQSRRAEVLRAVQAGADDARAVEDDAAIEGDVATPSPENVGGRVRPGVGAERLRISGHRERQQEAGHKDGRGLAPALALRARTERSRFHFKRYTALAASLMVLVAIGALLMPNPGTRGQASAGEIMVPDGGRLEAMDEFGRVIGPCPLKHTDVDVNVSGRFTRVTVTQQYHNPYDRKIEAVYTFPLSHRSAVDRMTMTIGDRVVIGEVKERQQARQIYEAARQQGNVASLLEQERPNIFTQSVANIEPGARVDIEISYVETLESADGVYTFDFPMVVGPRYIPGSPNSSGVLLPAELVERGGSVLLGPAQFSIEHGEDVQTHGTLQAGKLRTLLHAAHAIEFPGQTWWGLAPNAPQSEQGVIPDAGVLHFPVISTETNGDTTTVELEAGSRDGIEAGLTVILTRGPSLIARVRIVEATENQSVGEVVEYLEDATDIRIGDMGEVEDVAPAVDEAIDDNFIILRDENGNEVGRIDKRTIIPQIPTVFPPEPVFPSPLILPGPQGEPFTVIPSEPLPVLNMPAIWSPLEVTYCDGTTEAGQIFVDGTGHINGRWFFTDPNLVEGVGTGYAANTNQVPDASRITPMPVRPPTRAGHDIDVTVTIDTGGPGIEWVKSDLHDIRGEEQVLRSPVPPREVVLQLEDDDEIPNRDFVLSWRLEDDTIEESTFAHFGEYGEWSGGFFTLVLAPPARVEDADVRARELIFVLDTSGSMSGYPVEKGKEVMSKAIDAMRPGDAFNMITFAGDTHILWDRPRPNTAENRAEAQAFLASREGSGGTEMMKAIDAALRPQIDSAPDRPLMLNQLFDLPADGREVTVAIGLDQFELLGRDRSFFGRLNLRKGVTANWGAATTGDAIMEPIASIHADPDAKAIIATGQWRTFEGQRLLQVDSFAKSDDMPGEQAMPMRIVMFLTDGYVGDDDAIIHAVQEHAQTTRVFSFGIGNSVNRHLLDNLAKAGRGESEFVLIESDADAAVDRFATRIASPVLTDIVLDFDGVEVMDTIPSADFVPDLFDERPLIIHGRYTNPGEGTLRISGMTAAGRYERELPIVLPAAGEGDQNDVLGKLWARANIDEMTRIEETPDMRTQIIALGEAFQIMTNHTSFVAVDHSRVTVGGEPMLVPVPIELPDKVSWEGNFGDLDPNAVVDGAVAAMPLQANFSAIDQMQALLKIAAKLPANGFETDGAKQEFVNEQLLRVRGFQMELRYPEALEVIDEVLFIEPLNPAALVLRDSIRTAQLYQEYGESKKIRDRNIPQLSVEVQNSMVPPGVNLDGPANRSTESLMEYPEQWTHLADVSAGEELTISGAAGGQDAWYSGHVDSLSAIGGLGTTYAYYAGRGFDWTDSSHYVLTTEGIRKNDLQVGFGVNGRVDLYGAQFDTAGVPLGDPAQVGGRFRAMPTLVTSNGYSDAAEKLANINSLSLVYTRLPEQQPQVQVMTGQAANPDVQARMGAVDQDELIRQSQIMAAFAETAQSGDPGIRKLPPTTNVDARIQADKQLDEMMKHVAALDLQEVVSRERGQSQELARELNESLAAVGPEDADVKVVDRNFAIVDESSPSGDGQSIQFPWQQGRSPESSMVGRFRVVPIVRSQQAAILAPMESRVAIRAAVEAIDPEGVITFATPKFPHLFAHTLPLVVKAAVLPELASRFAQQTGTPFAGQDEASAIEWLNANLEAVFPDAETLADKSIPADGDLPVEIAKLMEELKAKLDTRMQGSRIIPPLKVTKLEFTLDISEDALRSPDGYRHYQEGNVIHIVTPEEYDEWLEAKENAGADESVAIVTQDETIDMTELDAPTNGNVVLQQLSERHGFNVISSKSVALPDEVDPGIVDLPIDEALDALFLERGYRWVRDGAFLYLLTEEEFAEYEANRAAEEEKAELEALLNAPLPNDPLDRLAMQITRMATLDALLRKARSESAAADGANEPAHANVLTRLYGAGLPAEFAEQVLVLISQLVERGHVDAASELAKGASAYWPDDPLVTAMRDAFASKSPDDAQLSTSVAAIADKARQIIVGRIVEVKERTRIAAVVDSRLREGTEAQGHEGTEAQRHSGTEGRVLVSVLLDSLNADVIAAIESAGLKIDDRDESRRFVVGNISRDDIEGLALVPAVRKIEPVE